MKTALLLMFAAACSKPLPDGVTVDEATAPVPFSTEQLAAYNTVGRTYVFRVDSAQTPPMRRTMQFDELGDDGAWVTSTIGAWDGADLAAVDTTRAYSTWAELQAHAAYDAASTTRSWGKAALPDGTVDCVLYTVDEGEGRMSTACFDPERPGPPVTMSQRQGDEVLFTMTLQASSVESL